MNATLLARLIVPCMIFAMLAQTSCRQEAPAAEPQPSASAQAVSQAVVEGAPTSTRVASIVFIGKEKACDCTRTRIDDTFAALQGALGGREAIRLERLRVDVDESRVATYREMRAMITLPAVYLLDGSGELVEMLQGEVTTAQFQAALDAP